MSETTPIHDRLADQYSEWDYDPIENAFQMRDWDEVERLTVEKQEQGLEEWAAEVNDNYSGFFADVRETNPDADLFTLSVPGVGYGVATSQEDYDAMVKYVARAGRKWDPRREDLLKARKYLDWAIENAEAEQ